MNSVVGAKIPKKCGELFFPAGCLSDKSPGCKKIAKY
jgi:hypothetical protein